MVKRFHCEFKNCNCCEYELFCSGRCKYCNHHKIWHSLRENPCKTNKTQFLSTRMQARKPKYISDKFNVITIFKPIPIVNAIPIVDNTTNFCITVEALPV